MVATLSIRDYKASTDSKLQISCHQSTPSGRNRRITKTGRVTSHLRHRAPPSLLYLESRLAPPREARETGRQLEIDLKVAFVLV
jgi:hypothetical protein